MTGGSHTDRLQHLQRWGEWLTGRLSPFWLVHEPRDGEVDGAMWRVGLPDGTVRWVYVAEQALTVPEDRFEELVARVDRAVWLSLLMTAEWGIRIYGDGRVEELEEPGG